MLSALGEGRDDWDLAIWCASVNNILEGRTPKDLLLAEPDRGSE